MNSCHEIKSLLVMHAEGALSPEESLEISSHLKVCASCGLEFESIAMVQDGLRDPQLFAPNEDLTWQMLPEKLAAQASQTGRIQHGRTRILVWAMSIASLVMLGFGLEWVMHRSKPGIPVAVVVPEQPQPPENPEFIGRMQSVLAREATAQYLSQCQDLLVNLMRAKRDCRDDKFDVSFEVGQARQLLRRKRLLDAELQSPGLAHARDLCDDLESFLVDLSISEKCETPVGMQRMERMIQKEKLLLRINVIQSELS